MTESISSPPVYQENESRDEKNSAKITNADQYTKIHFEEVLKAVQGDTGNQNKKQQNNEPKQDKHQTDSEQKPEEQHTHNKPEQDESGGSNNLPGLVLAVVGDSESFVPKPWNTTAFTSGLIKTVKGAKQCWIVCRGKRDGISKLIGETFKDELENDKDKDEKTSLIAIKPFTDPIQENNEQHYKYIFQWEKPKFQANKDYQEEYMWYNESLAWFLSHLSKQYTTLLSKKTDNKSEGTAILKIKVPVLLVVVEGDIATIHQVESAVSNNVPVLLVKGSGKAANFIAEYLETSEKKMLRARAPLLLGIYIRRELEKLQKIMDRIEEFHYLITIFDVDNTEDIEMEDAVVEAIIKGWSNQEHADTSAMHMKKPTFPTAEALYGSDKMTATRNVDEEREIRVSAKKTITCNVVDIVDERDYTRILDQKSKGFMEDFQFTLTPGSLSLYFYIAYQYIQEIIQDENEKSATNELQILLLEAVIADRVDYASAILQSATRFNPYHKEILYSETLTCRENCSGKDCRKIHAIHTRVRSSSGKKLWHTCKKENRITDIGYKKHEKHVTENRCRVRPLSCNNSVGPSSFKDETTNSSANYETSAKTSNNCIRCFNVKNEINTKSFMEAQYLCQELLNYKTLETSETEEKLVFHHLLAWALFANRKELAGLFWTKCENQLLTAIMASSILKNMAENVEAAKDRKLHEELLQHSKLFEERALEMQTTLYEDKEEDCMNLMMEEDTIWGIKVSPVACAYDNRLMDVIGHPCVQRKLNKEWYNDSAMKWTEWIKSIFCFWTKHCTDAWRAPISMFTFHYMFVLAVLFVYSAFILTDIQHLSSIKSIGPYEWLLYVWLLGDLVEEVVRNVVIAIKDYRNEKYLHILYTLVSNIWNWMTFLCYIMIGGGIVVRGFNNEADERMLIRFYSFGLFLLYMRFLQSMLVLKYFGPKIIMILKMLRELVSIGWLLLVFIACTGVLYHANMYPSHYDMWSPHGATYWRIWKIISLPYWQIYGELFLDELQGDNNSNGTCTFNRTEWESNPDVERCVDYDWSLMIIAACYMLITNLLLVNLVIALFTYRFEEVQQNSDRLWKYYRYSIITDYTTRFPVPFNLLFWIPYLLCCRQICSKPADPKTKMEKIQNRHATKCLYKQMTMKK